MLETGRKQRIISWVVFFFAFTMLAMTASHNCVKAAEKSLTIKEINYENSTITFHSEQGDRYLYFHKKGSSAWETANENFDKNGDLTMDISWISQTTAYQLQFKADQSTAVKSVTIPKQFSGLKASYNASRENPIVLTNTNDRQVEWRKNTYVAWSDWSDLKAADLNYLIANGATLYFRLKSENGVSADNPGKRAGKIVQLKITAKKTAPNITIDDAALSMNLTSGIMYRKAVLKDGEVDEVLTKAQEWTKITATKEYSLSELCPEALYSETDTKATVQSGLQFKTGSKGSSQESKIRTVLIPAQTKLQESAVGASIAYTSGKTLNLVISAATTAKPYQYCIVSKDEYHNGKLDYSELQWTDVKATTAISISKTKAPKGSHIFVRKKAVGVLGGEEYEIASSAIEVTSASGVDYPDAIALGTAQTYYMPAGMINTSDYGTNITFTTTSYTSTTVSDILFCNSNGGEIGGVKFTSTVAVNKDSKSSSDKYIITTKITDTSELETKLDSLYRTSQQNYYGTKLYAKITLANDSANPIMSTDTNGVILSLTPRSEAVLPTNAGDGTYEVYNKHYMKDFQRLYLCTRSTASTTASNIEDDYFKFILAIGEKYAKDRTSGATGAEVVISSISYDDCYLYQASNATLSGNLSAADLKDSVYTDAALGNSIYQQIFTVRYQNYTDAYGNTDARRAFVTVNAKKLEEVLRTQKGTALVKTDAAKNLVITLSNGEVIADDISILLRATATIDGGSVSYANTAGTLQEPYVEITYDNNGNEKSRKTVTPVEYSFTLTMFDSSYTKAEVTDVKWGDTSILGKMSRSGTKITIELSNSKINKLTTGQSASATKNLQIIFSNGYILENGCQLTLLNN